MKKIKIIIMERFSICQALFFSGCIVVLFVCSCQQPGRQGEVRGKRHMAEVNMKGMGMMYLDKIPNSAVMQIDSTDPSEYQSYLVGFIDSNLVIAPDSAKERYFQYDMYKDWVAVGSLDSIAPVFFHPKTKITRQEDEAILVFEVPKGDELSALVYKDSHGPWGIQKIILNN
jgi:hypothetical protein